MTATLHHFPSPLDHFLAEVCDAAEPFRGICLDAAKRLTPAQRLELEAWIIEEMSAACAVLTEGLERPGDELMERTIKELGRFRD